LETVCSHCGVDGRDKPGHDGIDAFLCLSFASFAYPSAHESTTVPPVATADLNER
jgi:hypothetical protein